MSSENSEHKKNDTEQDPLAPEDIEGSEDSAEQSSKDEDGMDYPAVIEALRAELNQSKDHMMRALAEAENTRKRAQKDREDASKFALSGFAKDLLSVADNLRRALDAVPEDLAAEDVRAKNLLDGIEATERELHKSFEKNGLSQINPAGEAFDPNFHEVMFEAPGTGQPAGTIIEVIETGYALNGRLIRPARVGVAKDDGKGTGGADSQNDEPGSQIDTEA